MSIVDYFHSKDLRYYISDNISITSGWVIKTVPQEEIKPVKMKSNRSLLDISNGIFNDSKM